MKTIKMRRSEIIGHKILYSVMSLPYFLLLYSGVKIMMNDSSDSFLKGLGTGIFVMSSFMIIVFLLVGFKKFHMDIKYDNDSIEIFFDEEPTIIKIQDVTEFSNHYVTIKNYKGHIGHLLLRLKLNSGENVDIRRDYYHKDELEQLFKHCKEINPNIKDNYFKYFKYGEFIPEEGWYEYIKRMDKENFDKLRNK